MATITNTNYFIPTQISGCSLWLDAADSSTVIVSPGTQNVTRWNDKSGSLNDATPYSASPLYVSNLQNGLPGITFNANMLRCPAFLTSTNASIFIVTKITTNNTMAFGVWKVQFGSFFTIGNSPTIGVGVNNTATYTNNASISAIANTQTHIYGCSLTSSTTPGSAFTFNGSANGTNTTITGTSTSGNAATCAQQVGIGGIMENGIPFYQLVGNIHEVIVITTTLTTIQRQAVEGYLAWKWGTQASLPTTHPYFYNPMIPNLILPAPLANPLTTTNTTLTTMNPTQIAGCSLWLDAADANSVSRTGVNVTGWNDKSGNGYTVTAASPYQPTYTSDTISFNGSQFFTTNYTNSPAAESIFMIVNVSVTTGEGNFLQPNQVGGRQLYVSSNILCTARSGIVNSLVAGTIPLNNRTLIETTNSGTSLNHFINGLNVGSNNSVVAYSGSGSTSIGSRVNGGSGITGSIHEIVIFNSALSTQQRQQIEGYLAWKWGLQANLQTTHPYFYNPLIPNLILPSQIYTLVPSFSPVRFSGLGLWLDAADTASVVTSGSSVTQWNDKSGNGRNMTPTASLQYVTTFNGSYPSIFGANNVTGVIGSISSFTLSNPSTVFAVIQNTGVNSGTTNFPSLFNIGSVNRAYAYTYNQTIAPGVIRISVGSGSLDAPTGGNSSTAQVFTMDMGVSSTTTYQNGSPTVTQNFPGATVSSSTLSIGAWTGHFCEFMIFTSPLTTNQRQQIEGYLAWKWGLQTSLPTTHPYFFAPPS